MRTIDLDLLRQVTTDALRVYEATQRSEQLLADAQRAVECAGGVNHKGHEEHEGML